MTARIELPRYPSADHTGKVARHLQSGQQPVSELFAEQVEHLRETHFLVLFWAAKAESKSRVYNLTNAFDDLKAHDITRTKQTAMACVEALCQLRFLNVRDERNRKNLYITTHGAKAIEQLATSHRFQVRRSTFLEGIA